MSKIILASALSDKGSRKAVNQDACYYAVDCSGEMPIGIFAVADGVSGSYRGEIASHLCTGGVEDWWKTVLPTVRENKSKAIASIAELIIGLNNRVRSGEYDARGRSSTTLSILFLHSGEWFTFNVGDSRIFCLKKGLFSQLKQLTADQSCLVEREHNGQKYLKSVLTCCIGGRGEFKYEYANGKITVGDRFLICSDGVFKTQTNRQLKQLLNASHNTPDEICRSFITTALSNGETDNITAITVFC